MAEKTEGQKRTDMILVALSVAGVFTVLIGGLTFLCTRDSTLNPHYRDYGRPAQSVEL